MAIERRAFIATAACASVLPSAFAATRGNGGKPLFTIGVLTDTHVTRKPESCGRIRMAYTLFKKLGVDRIVNCGDISNRFWPEAYGNYRDTVRSVYGEKKPDELFVYAYHDVIDYPPPNGDKSFAALGKVAFPEVKRLLGITNDPYEYQLYRGYPFIVVPQTPDIKKLEAMLKKARNEAPGKPIFLFGHEPPEGTTHNSTKWGNLQLYTLLSKYPQVVHTTGHVHGDLRNEEYFWQGTFTEFNAGCLYGWASGPRGYGRASFISHTVAVMEVFPDRIDIRRYDIRDGEEIRPNAPWSVPLPYNPETAPFRRGARHEKAPEFAAEAKASASVDGNPLKGVHIRFPHVTGETRAFLYELDISRITVDGTLVRIGTDDFCGDFHLRRQDRILECERTVSAAFFDIPGRYKIDIVPRGFCGMRGKALAVEIESPGTGGKKVWESFDIPKDAPLVEGGKDPKPIKLSDGWYSGMRSWPFDAWPHLEIPEVCTAPAGTKYRVTVDFQTEPPPGRRVWLLEWGAAKKAGGAEFLAKQQYVPARDDSRLQRAVFEWTKGKAYPESAWTLYLRAGHSGKIRFEHIKIETLQKSAP